MGLLVRNGEIVTVGSRTRADIYAENETVTRIGKNLEAPPGTEIIDATGKLVFPGFIDPSSLYGHFREGRA
jgi:dihydropyrimidinase